MKTRHLMRFCHHSTVLIHNIYDGNADLNVECKCPFVSFSLISYEGDKTRYACTSTCGPYNVLQCLHLLFPRVCLHSFRLEDSLPFNFSIFVSRARVYRMDTFHFLSVLKNVFVPLSVRRDKKANRLALPCFYFLMIPLFFFCKRYIPLSCALTFTETFLYRKRSCGVSLFG